MNLKIIVFIFMSIIGIVGFYLSEKNSYRLLFFAFIATPLYLMFDYLFKRLSYKFQKRDFYLWLRYSDEIDYTLNGMGTNKHIKATDVIFSMILLFLIFGYSITGILLFGKDEVYNQLIQ